MTRSFLAVVFLSIAVHAQPGGPGGPGDPGSFEPCTESVSLNTSARVAANSAPLPGFVVTMESTSQIVKHFFGSNCSGESSSAVTAFTWSLDVPEGSATRLQNARQRRIDFTPDRPGTYVVRYTACPQACQVTYISGHTATRKPIRTTEELGPETRNISFVVREAFQVPPRHAPPLQPSSRAPGSTTLVPATTPQPYSRQKGMCPGTVGIYLLWHNQWIATAFNQPRFDLAEGIVYSSHISSADDIRNHHKMDAVAHIDVDPPFRHLLAQGINSQDSPDPARPFGGLEIEWEFDLWKEPMRPRIGDRMSVLGYHILDCDHDKKSEIHPPVAVAVHRPRPVRLPATLPEPAGNPAFRDIGQNVIVPGIVTDIWANLAGGEALDCDSTGLQIPLDPPVPDEHQPGGKRFKVCATQPNAPQSPFVFHIYLPPGPKQLLSELGFERPNDAPLFVSVVDHPQQASLGARGDLPVTIIERVLDGPVPYLTVQVDLSSLPRRGRFAKRIVTAWAYPDLTSNNWAARSLGLQLSSLRVTDDGELGLDDGDWRMWLSSPSESRPWIKLLDCEGCVDDDSTYTPSSGIWASGALAAGGMLANDMLVFGNQLGLVTTAGFDEDLVWNDAIGNGSAVFGGAVPLRVNASKYTANLNVIANPPLPRASISARLRAHTDNLRAGDISSPRFRLEEFLSKGTSIFQLQSAWGAAAAKRIREVEPRDVIFSPTGMRAPLEKSPADQQEAFVLAIRKQALERLGENPDEKRRAAIAAELAPIKAQIPPALYQKHLCDIETGRPCP